jgi:hypothetical protein
VLHIVCSSNVYYLTALSVSRLLSVGGGVINECGAVGGMSVCRGNRNTLRKPVSVSLCPSEIPHDLTWD